MNKGHKIKNKKPRTLFSVLSSVSYVVFIFLIITAWLFSGWPRIWQKPRIPPNINEALAA
jgi:hypothetical protein